MQEVEIEDRIPAPGHPERSLAAGAGRPRKFIRTRRGTSRQHLDGRPAQNRRLKSRQKLGHQLSILALHLNSFSLVPTGKYMTTVTEFGCIPISTAYQTSQFGWAVTRWVHMWVHISISAPTLHPAPLIYLLFLSFFNNVIGITDPSQLNPPSFCSDEDTEVDAEEEPRDFLSLFLWGNIC